MTQSLFILQNSPSQLLPLLEDSMKPNEEFLFHFSKQFEEEIPQVKKFSFLFFLSFVSIKIRFLNQFFKKLCLRFKN